MVFLNESGTIGTILSYVTYEITGSLFLTLLGVVLMIMLLAVLFRIPIEFTAIFILPLLLTLMAYDSNFMAIGGVFLIFVGILMAKNFFFKIQ